MENLLKDYPFRGVLSLKTLIDHLNKIMEPSREIKPCLKEDFRDMLSRAPELYEPIEDLTILERHRDVVQKIMSLVFPPATWDMDAVGAVIPFSVKPFFVSPCFQRLFLDEDGSFLGRINVGEEHFNKGRIIRAYLFILKKFYGIQQHFDYPLIRIVPDSETGLDRHYKMNVDFRFVEAHAVKKPKPLTDEERRLILEHITEPEVIREILPPENFELHGFSILRAVDVTEAEVLSALERDLIDQESVTSQSGFLRVQQRLRTFFRHPELVTSLAAIQEDMVLLLNTGCRLTHSCLFADSHHIPISKFKGTIFERATQGEDIVRVPDILEEPTLQIKGKELFQEGIRSLMIVPLYYQGTCIGTLDLGSPHPGDLVPMDGLLISQIQPLFSMAMKRALDDLNNSVQAVIKEKCTAIHPTVEWRFRKAVLHHLENLRMGRDSEVEPIVFNDVYPLYGISDIRGSTNQRNLAVQGDLLEHLNLALNVVLSAADARPLPILQELHGRIAGNVERITHELGTGDEVSVVNFLREEVEPVFDDLEEFGLKVRQAIRAYRSAVDPKLGTVYNRRREFEESIHVFNNRIAAYLDQEETKSQTIFPHYFERHRTDGVDYLIYAGSSLTEKGGFSQLYLKNLRIWQLMMACGIAWHTEHLKSSLKVPLDVAHLILVQNSPISIRFRFDEKRFDVDGANNIRYEIIKSRLDKAEVKGTHERLTQPGMIAVVYSHPQEAQEMRHHIDSLRLEGYLNDDLEDLELEDLPGVPGLRSLRVGINLQSPALAHRVEQMAW